MSFSIFMRLQKRPNTKQMTLRSLFFCFVLGLSCFSHAELEELDDKRLDEQTAKAGITIDLSFKLSIKEILFDYSDRAYNENNSKTALTPPPPRIEYIHDND